MNSLGGIGDRVPIAISRWYDHDPCDWLRLGLKKKLEAREPARARSGSRVKLSQVFELVGGQRAEPLWLVSRLANWTKLINLHNYDGY
jgi:hypothetical protein